MLAGALRQANIKITISHVVLKNFRRFLDKVNVGARSLSKKFTISSGLRVICLFLSDIPRVGEVIRKSFNVLSEDDKIEGVEISSFGYLSFHFIAENEKRIYKGRDTTLLQVCLLKFKFAHPNGRMGKCLTLPRLQD